MGLFWSSERQLPAFSPVVDVALHLNGILIALVFLVLVSLTLARPYVACCVVSRGPLKEVLLCALRVPLIEYTLCD